MKQVTKESALVAVGIEWIHIFIFKMDLEEQMVSCIGGLV